MQLGRLRLSNTVYIHVVDFCLDQQLDAFRLVYILRQALQKPNNLDVFLESDNIWAFFEFCSICTTRLRDDQRFGLGGIWAVIVIGC